jgi:ADP-heptose:LPS heptosyltransferase
MDFFPEIGLLNNFYLGDDILLEPIARTLAERLPTQVYIVSRNPELFIGHPNIKSLHADRKVPAGMRIIDMNDAIRSLEGGADGGLAVVLPGKLERMYEAAGLKERDITAPKLHLTDVELDKCVDLDGILPDKRIGIALESRHSFKNVPYTKFLIKRLIREGFSVFAFGKDTNGDYAYLDKLPVMKVIDKPLREAMIYMALMDVFLGPDTGLLHIAGALEVPFIVITREVWRDLYDCYDIGEILAARQFGKHSLKTLPVTPRRILKAVKRQYQEEEITPESLPKPKKRSPIALFRLDGLGGTLTLADQAKKVYEAVGVKPDLIIRSYGQAFQDNPYVENIVEVGHVVWKECLDEMLQEYATIGEIRFAPGKWHQNGKEWFEQDFTELQEIFDAFPTEHRAFEIHEMHQVQVTDMTMGLPYNSIDMEIFYDETFPDELPDRFIAMNNGVDIQHKGMRQTKTWDGWNALIPLLDMPVVQVGTVHDPLIVGAIDLRGQTSLGQLFYILKQSDAVLTTEGGMMHIAYALNVENAFIMRGPTRGKLFEYPGQRMIDSHICDICWSSTDDWYANCPKKIDSVCMGSITPERVAYNISEVLNEAVA